MALEAPWKETDVRPKALLALVVAGILSVFALSTASAQVAPPTAVPDVVATLEDTAKVVAVLANDSNPSGGALTVKTVSDPAHGKTVINGGTTVTYTPDANWSGVDVFTYSISNGTHTASATVVVTVAAVNDAPVAKADSVTTTKNTAQVIHVLANDKDVDGNALTVIVATQPSHGTATVGADKRITYKPAANYTGADSFTYLITDGSLTATAKVSVTVKAASTPSDSTFDQRVRAACQDDDRSRDVKSLCQVYQKDNVSQQAKNTIGQLILKKVSSKPVGADQICRSNGLNSDLRMLCEVYRDDDLSRSTRHLLGLLIEGIYQK